MNFPVNCFVDLWTMRVASHRVIRSSRRRHADELNATSTMIPLRTEVPDTGSSIRGSATRLLFAPGLVEATDILVPA